MKIIDNESKKYGLGQISHGNEEMHFALINPDTGETITPYCKCKDFFQDLWWSYETKKDASIFGFRWKSDNHRELLERGGICVSMILKERISGRIIPLTKEQGQSTQALLNKFDKALKFNTTIVEQDEDEQGLIIYYDTRYSKIPYLNSSLFLLLRSGITYKGGDVIEQYCGSMTGFKFVNDITVFKSKKQVFIDLLNGKVDNKQIYSNYNDTSHCHNCSGVLSYNEYKID